MMFPPSMKFDILVGLASILGKLMLVERLGSSRLGLRISRLLGLGSFRSLDTRACWGFSRPEPRTRWEPPGGGFGSILRRETISLMFHECLFRYAAFCNQSSLRLAAGDFL